MGLSSSLHMNGIFMVSQWNLHCMGIKFSWNGNGIFVVWGETSTYANWTFTVFRWNLSCIGMEFFMEWEFNISGMEMES